VVYLSSKLITSDFIRVRSSEDKAIPFKCSRISDSVKLLKTSSTKNRTKQNIWHHKKGILSYIEAAYIQLIQ